MDNTYIIINYLGKNLTKFYTMHALSQILKIPYASFYRTIQQMKDLLVIQPVGKAKTIRLDLQNPVIKAYLIIGSYEKKKEFIRKHPVIKKIMEDTTTDVVGVFGSYAKATQTTKSDIDIVIINQTGTKTISFSKHELLYNIKINPIYITYKEFKDMLKNKDENIAKQILSNHIILQNSEEFWGCVLDVFR
ncbi:hypothetical protein CL622_08970 [archaeon]|nr:hypothetical protein [archaeon]